MLYTRHKQRKKDKIKIQKPTTTPYHEPTESIKSNNDKDPPSMYNLTQSQIYTKKNFQLFDLCFQSCQKPSYFCPTIKPKKYITEQLSKLSSYFYPQRTRANSEGPL